ncbi:hypothetical protein DCAR_0728786 [Daucus carota subsp. sativus]|uniref:Uncharacterized protein n=1 Tax=Daucus carota subsp. sativus TaxID=79200 RepID=A0A164TUH6_DAUCS|nr:PREDICTED: uncharacterized protein At1g76070-like [Daucus carota subsp. sativus]WOH09329.1 hypothetical protein DCAR_0728786 [Daucus carota subsp. sativus]
MGEKAAVSKAKNRFLKLLSKPPFSPNKEKSSSDKSKSKGFSGASDEATMTSIVPVGALYSKSRNSSLREPTSPIVSCMGQIKHKKKLYSLINTNYAYQDSVLPPMDHLSQVVQNHKNSKQGQQKPPPLKSVKSFGDVKKKKKPLPIRKMFSRVPSGRRKSDTTIYLPDDHTESSCSLSQMKRFSSGRNLSNFDWTKVAQVVDNSEKGSIAPSILQECKAVTLGPKKEVNLWKRRTMAQPSPLQLKT